LLKATFDISLITRKGTVALANTQAIETRPSDGRIAQPDAAPFNQSEKGPKVEGKVETEKGPKTEGTSGDEWVLTRYATTPRMSTYLVAYANGDFEHLESHFTSPLTGEKIPLRIYATKENIHQVSGTVECHMILKLRTCSEIKAQLALDVTARILPEYEKAFDIAYPLKKLDTLVASDFDAGECCSVILDANDQPLTT
jgi:aminopeptidase 2